MSGRRSFYPTQSTRSKMPSQQERNRKLRYIRHDFAIPFVVFVSQSFSNDFDRRFFRLAANVYSFASRVSAAEAKAQLSRSQLKRPQRQVITPYPSHDSASRYHLLRPRLTSVHSPGEPSGTVRAYGQPISHLDLADLSCKSPDHRMRQDVAIQFSGRLRTQVAVDIRKVGAKEVIEIAIVA